MGTNNMKQTNPFCPDCDVEMEEVEWCNDWADHNGEHQQETGTDYKCPNCKEQYDGRMFKDDGSDDYDDQD